MTDKDILLHMVRELEEENQRLKKGLLLISKFIYSNYPNNTKLLRTVIRTLGSTLNNYSEEKEQ